jgi:hypothetical protein
VKSFKVALSDKDIIALAENLEREKTLLMLHIQQIDK